MLDFFIHLLIPAYGQFVTIKTSQGEFSFGKLYFSQKQLISHIKTIFPGKVQIPKWAPFVLNGTANQIAGKSWNHRGSIGHLTPWPENPGYRTQVWDNSLYKPNTVHYRSAGINQLIQMELNFAILKTLSASGEQPLIGGSRFI